MHIPRPPDDLPDGSEGLERSFLLKAFLPWAVWGGSLPGIFNGGPLNDEIGNE